MRPRSLFGFSLVYAVVCSLAFGCGAAPFAPLPPTHLPVPTVRLHEVPPPRCGNGVVDEGELCDPRVIWARRCPEPWGVCWACAPACNAFVPQRSAAASSEDRPFCHRTVIGQVRTRKYDAYGQRTVDVSDYNSDRRYDEWRYQYDRRGRIVRRDADLRGGNERRQQAMVHFYDGEHRVRTLRDDDLDGEQEYVYDYVYFDGGLPQHITSTDAENVVRVSRQYTYDRDGQWLSVVINNPSIGERTTRTRRFDRWGRVTYLARASDGELVTESRTTFVEGGARVTTRDAAGQIVAAGSDTSPWRRVHERSYNEQGFLVETRTIALDVKSGPELVRVDTSEYDEHHNLVARHTRPVGGTSSVVESMGYECLHEVFEQMPRRAFTERDPPRGDPFRATLLTSRRR